MEHIVIDRCQRLAACTEEPGHITRTFLSTPMHAVHAHVREWMEAAGMRVRVDAAGNIRGRYEGTEPEAGCFYLGSHLDTVPHAGAYDGILGVILAIAVVESLAGHRYRFAIEVLGFSEEEGVRLGKPFLGSLAAIGELDTSLPGLCDAIRDFGLDPAQMPQARMDESALGYLEFHIEQGPVLEALGRDLAVVEAIVGQSRYGLTFEGRANHAGTTPMPLRQDALAGAAEWVLAVERVAFGTPGLVATAARFVIEPLAGNVIAGVARASLDVRHADDQTRLRAVAKILQEAQEIAVRRGLRLEVTPTLDQPAVAMSPALTGLFPAHLHRMTSGAGHDAMIVARRMPAAMLFLRSPGGISHHPDESVRAEDAAAALAAGRAFLDRLEASLG